MAKEYTATAIMYVAPNREEAPEISQTSLSELNYLQKIVISYIEVLKTERFLDSVAKQSDLDYDAGQLMNKVTINVINITEYFKLQVITKSPDESLRIADTITRLAPGMISDINPADTIRVLSPAKLPTGPSGPSLLKSILAGAALGIFLGVILAFALNKRDKRIRDRSDLQKRFVIPVLGHVIIPSHAMEPIAGIKPSTYSSERYGELLVKLLNGQNSDFKKIMFTSPEPDAAKSTNCYNLGIMLAQATTAKVLIIDCDYRRPDPQNASDLKHSALYTYFKFHQLPGLSQMLSIKNNNSRFINRTDYPNLDVLCRGNIPNNPTEILGSPAMKDLLDSLAAQYDYILIDTPAITTNPDALALARFVDKVILVVMQGKTTYQDIGLAISTFSINNLKVAGMILNSRIYT